MSHRPIILALLALAVGAGTACKGQADTPVASVPRPAEARAATSTVPASTTCTPLAAGVVALERQDALSDFLNDNLDRPVAVRFRVARPTPAQSEAGFGADIDEGRLLLTFSPGLGEGGWEAVVPAGSYRSEGSGWTVDGVFVVRSGGMHQGIVAYALETPAMPPAAACASGMTL